MEELEPWGTPARRRWVSFGLGWHSLAVGVTGDQSVYWFHQGETLTASLVPRVKNAFEI